MYYVAYNPALGNALVGISEVVFPSIPEGRIVTTYNSGKKKYSKPIGDTTIINKTVVVQQTTDGAGVTPTEEEMYAKRVDFINDNLFYKGEVAGPIPAKGVYRDWETDRKSVV